MHALLIVFALSACGRYGFDERHADANPVPSPDAPFGFATPTIITEVSDPLASDQDPFITADGLEMFLASTRAGGLGDLDIWASRRKTIGDPWGIPEHVPELSSAVMDVHPKLSPDGLTVFVTSRRPSTFDIYTATRSASGKPWGALVAVAELSDAVADDVAASFTESNLQLAFASNRVPPTMGAVYDLYGCDRPDPESPWSVPAPLVEINTTSVENSPFASADGTFIAFYSDRPGGQGMFDLYYATRPDPGVPFDAPVPVPGLNTPFEDVDPWFAPDRRHVVFSSDREGGYEIYEAFLAP